jgi:hypothetical protein
LNKVNEIIKKKKVPENIIRNLTDQIPPLRVRPKRLEEYTEEEINSVPRLFEWFVYFSMSFLSEF